MLAEAIELQKNAVKKLVDCVLSEDRSLTFKAPTGSGKTFMMADMIDQLLVHPDILKGYDCSVNGVIFLVSSLSKSDLAKQNYEKFVEYSEKKFFENLNPYLINSEVSGEERLFIPTYYNVYFLPRDLYRQESRLMRGGMESFLQNMTTPKDFGGQGKKIILIKDECQIATNNLDGLNHYFDKVINFSATPTSNQLPATVEITEDDAVSTKLIKSVNWQDDTETLSDALNKYTDIKKIYPEMLGVNPCLIIQISNKDKADEELLEIHQELNKRPELQWMLIVNEEKKCDTNNLIRKYPVSKWKDVVKENTSTIDIIIFKMVISEGWDMPRACMLYQIRDSQSKQLDEQVIGRIRRNPRLLDYETLTPEQQKLAMQSWVWGVHNAKNQDRQWKSVKLQGKELTAEIKIKTTKLKNLTQTQNFDIEQFIKSQSTTNAYTNIFKLGRKIRKLDTEIQEEIYKYATDYQKWWVIAEHTDALKKEFDNYICEYTESMEITQENGRDKEVSFPITSQFMNTNFPLMICDNVWRIKGGNGYDYFSFDSEAEFIWANILKDISQRDLVASTTENNDLFGSDKEIYLWGKNYIPNSNIKFEYYLNGIHSSYPDFIMKDKKGNIHIFEVKSVNDSNSFNIDRQAYENKISELKKSYRQASKLTKHIFYIPLLRDNNWLITKYEKGEEYILTQREFIESLT